MSDCGMCKKFIDEECGGEEDYYSCPKFITFIDDGTEDDEE